MQTESRQPETPLATLPTISRPSVETSSPKAPAEGEVIYDITAEHSAAPFCLQYDRPDKRPE